MSSLSIDLFLKPSKVPFPVLFSLVLVIVMLSLLALLGFFFIIFKDWSFAQLALSNVSKSPKWPNYAHITPLLFALHWLPIGSQIQYRIALTCFHMVSGTDYSSSIPLQGTSSLYKLHHLYSASHSFCLESNTRIFHVLRIGRRTPGERPFQINTSDLSCGTEFLSSSFCQAFLFTLFF